MKGIDTRLRTRGRNPVLAGLATARRRRILAILLRESTSIGESDLARRLASAGPISASRAEPKGAEAVHTEIRHVHLPALDAAGLVEWDEPGATVSLADHPLFTDEDALAVLDAGEEYDEVLDCLADVRRRTVLSTLEAQRGTVDRTDLAAAVLARVYANDLSVGALDCVHVSLRHVHLPKLADAGLVSLASDAVALTDDDRLETAWAVVDALDC